MDYYELRKALSRAIPRRTQLEGGVFGRTSLIKEKGRKSNYYQFDLERQEMLKNERLLNTETINNFAEISLRASACPMPFNVDVWDGVACQFGCKYCFANLHRVKLYTAFFDNTKSMGLRHCNIDYYKEELDKLLLRRGESPEGNGLQRAICKNIPLRFGIRFEDFLPIEGTKKISLSLLQYLGENNYPVMINTKSDLVGRDDYLKALVDNKGGAAVHVTLISSNNKILKKLEPGAPSYERKLEAIRRLSQAGVRAVARIEPYMAFINDGKEDVDKYIEDLLAVGCTHITFDTYHVAAQSPGIYKSYYEKGFDFEKMWLATTDSQPIGSLMLGKYMELFRAKGISCSTFDLGNVTTNDDKVCCEINGVFDEIKSINSGSIVTAIQFIKSRGGKPTDWATYVSFVESSGGFLSEGLKDDVHKLWNVEGNGMFHLAWAAHIEPIGWNEDGFIWRYNLNYDYRQKILEGIL
jgi:DNA repair photolyase